MIIIGRNQQSVDNMEKEGGLLADRPRTVAAGEFCLPFRRLRKATYIHLQAKAAEPYAPIQMDAARNVIFDIFDNPKEHQAVANHPRPPPWMLKRFQNLMRPGALLVERFPIIRYLPGYTTELEEWRREESQLFHDQLNRVLKEFTRLAVAIMVVVTAAACYPKAQEKVQEELDTVIGRDRCRSTSPTLDDYAFMLECLRWRPVTTLGFAHCALTDIPYFDPEKWLDSDGKIREDLKFPSYGFGRRICPGQHIANHSIFIKLALLLWSFNITQDPENPIDQSGFVDGVIAHPKHFAARFEPRFGDDVPLGAVMAKYGEGL
ncbi:cytochrome P450 [Suillus discolor]|uniref:Cytochrome P450 n=1 Tax=Suillus discolor TaxID=1912936 RepID=A0A9P7EVD5_9AGAM|nr:cytochrome P450 [Suillus discolor]KAG2090364.1 cytochrome P450 [Suillus discolor]